LLCPTHHGTIDKNEEDFPVEKLHILKSRHELWVQDTLEKEVSNKSKEFRPVSNLLYLVEQIKPFLFWLNRTVPPNKAEAFLSYLQSLWHSSIVIERIDRRLTNGMDNLLRPISSTHFFSKSGQNYDQSKLYVASRYFSRYFKDRGFEWDDVESDFETTTILDYLERNAKEIDKNNERLDWDEINIIRLILYVVSYCKNVQRVQEYIGISEGFVRQSHAVIEGFLKNELGYELPNAFDGGENENLHDYYEYHPSYDEGFYG
jgi:hypothetical protein